MDIKIHGSASLLHVGGTHLVCQIGEQIQLEDEREIQATQESIGKEDIGITKDLVLVETLQQKCQIHERRLNVSMGHSMLSQFYRVIFLEYTLVNTTKLGDC